MSSEPDEWDVRIGHEELRVRGRYEVISIVNDILIGLWFVVGSILFFFDSTVTAGTWLFLIGSIQLVVRPLIRLHRRVTLGRIGGQPGFGGARDF
ncbi:MAG TPA: YrhK family protein [Ornithinimicrobium sp.]|uniref:YrhK family protein n=1 Tax=Ornithinimicrobium sp. TaxID=1977084 RepID=UPI002B46114D|nr:YrhK family protein [Ornithinimicrobium sp.]HKJ12531.1 YrhK family protein [Ornithinimicrobium sp.]